MTKNKSLKSHIILPETDEIYYDGKITGSLDKYIGYICINELKNKKNTNSPNFTGIINIKGIGQFKVALWEQKKRYIIKKGETENVSGQ